jgi:BirA family transcriptional regulator, biotin operon repressor / biotin---[acetyl-CoA-carboxylase] ligase
MARTWIAPGRSSILMSLVMRPSLAPSELGRATMAVALGACDAIRTETGLDAQIKWPNDILLNDRKCAGILAEANIVGDRVEYVIVGLGLNVNFAVASITGIPAEATTISSELGKPFSRVRLVQSILTHIEPYYGRMNSGESLRADWAARLTTLHQHVFAHTPWGEETGIAEDTDTDGALLIRRADGSMIRLIAGDVTLSMKHETR